MLRAILLSLLLVCSFPAYAAMDCDTVNEDKIKQVISEDPTKVVAILTDSKVQGFFSAMVKRGYMMGMLSNVDHIYIVDAGKLPGYTSDNVWLWFVSDGCLIYARGATKNVILDLLKEVQ